MISLKTTFLGNVGISGSCSPLPVKQRGVIPIAPSSFKVVALNPNRDRNGSILMENTLQEFRDGASVLDFKSKSTVAGGVQDVYGEDTATEDQLVTPWSLSVARRWR